MRPAARSPSVPSKLPQWDTLDKPTLTSVGVFVFGLTCLDCHVEALGAEYIFDPTYYKDRLKTIWNRNRTTTAQDRMAQLASDMAGLTTALPYISGDDEKEVRAILCRYHHLHAHISRDQGRYDVAIAELKKVAIVAERAERPHLLTVTLLGMGSVLRDRGDVTEALAKIEAAGGNSTAANQNRAQANADYRAAIGQYSRIRNLERVPPALNGVLLFDEGYAQAHLARGNRDRILAALTLLKNGGKIIAETRGGCWYVL